MKLSEYLKHNELTYEAFGQQIGLPFQMVGKYVAGAIPRRPIMERISAATAGQVTANDFYDIATPPAAAGAVGAGEEAAMKK